MTTAALPPLARSTVDRAARHRTDPEWLEKAWPRARVVVVDVVGGGLFLFDDQTAAVVYCAPSDVDESADRLFLGEAPDGTPYFAVVGMLPDVPGTRTVNLRDVAHRLDDTDAGLVTTAVALAHWHARHPYSAESGRPTVVTDAGWVRQDDAGTPSWPRTDPAVIVLVHDGVPGDAGRCLLGQNAAWQGAGRRMSCLAGFVEPGESAEATVLREVAEEVGVVVRDVRYVASQAWPFPGSLMLGFFALADPTDVVTTDPTEIAEAAWLTRRDVRRVLAGDEELDFRLSAPSSIAHFLISTWAAESS